MCKTRWLKSQYHTNLTDTKNKCTDWIMIKPCSIRYNTMLTDIYLFLSCPSHFFMKKSFLLDASTVKQNCIIFQACSLI